MNSNVKAMVLASFAADSLSLGVHWIYNTNVIDKKWGRVETYIKPERPTYHPTKDLGEFTHYGDQTMFLLESISAHAGFDLNDFADRWQQLFNTYDGYFDGATKATIENIASGKPSIESGSDSDDFAGAARIAPLAYIYQNDLEPLITSVRAQTALTHNNPLIKPALWTLNPIHAGSMRDYKALRVTRDRSSKISDKCVKSMRPFRGWYI
jgi:ADP-ribosylglycohydrolase